MKPIGKSDDAGAWSPCRSETPPAYAKPRRKLRGLLRD